MDVLEQILNKSEIKVYFALLELESSTVGPIIERARITDSKIYSILDKLVEKGLVSFVVKNNVKHFRASHPSNLVDILNEKEKEIISQKKELKEKLIPQIEQRRKLTREQQEATVYESYDGVKSAFNLILGTLKRGEEYQGFMLGGMLGEKRVINFFKNYHKKRLEKGIKVRLLSHISLKSIVKKNHIYKDMKVKFTDQKLPIGTFIFKDHVMTVIWKDKPTVFMIKSKMNYEYYKEFFEGIWK